MCVSGYFYVNNYTKNVWSGDWTPRRWAVNGQNCMVLKQSFLRKMLMWNTPTNSKMILQCTCNVATGTATCEAGTERRRAKKITKVVTLLLQISRCDWRTSIASPVPMSKFPAGASRSHRCFWSCLWSWEPGSFEFQCLDPSSPGSLSDHLYHVLSC